MPLKSYRMMHGNARLSADKKKELLDFFRDNEYSK
nr:heme-binding domain-containing protein [Elizabethkingia bruuniana]